MTQNYPYEVFVKRGDDEIQSLDTFNIENPDHYTKDYVAKYFEGPLYPGARIFSTRNENGDPNHPATFGIDETFPPPYLLKGPTIENPVRSADFSLSKCLATCL